jgi:hypothetical protein
MEKLDGLVTWGRSACDVDIARDTASGFVTSPHLPCGVGNESGRLRSRHPTPRFCIRQVVSRSLLVARRWSLVLVNDRGWTIFGEI